MLSEVEALQRKTQLFFDLFACEFSMLEALELDHEHLGSPPDVELPATLIILAALRAHVRVAELLNL